MKTRLNLLSLVLLLIFGLHIGNSMLRGSNRAQRDLENSQIELNHSSWLELDTHHPIVIDSIFNEKRNVWMPVQTETVTLFIPDRGSLSYLFSDFMFLFVSLFFLLILMVCFYKVIKSVKDAIFFDRKNIKRLRLIGICFLALWIAINIRSLVMSWTFSALFENTVYSLKLEGLQDPSFLIYAFIAFLVAEIFAIGLRLKEEQDLTI